MPSLVSIVESCEVEETEKGTRELRHSSPSGAFEHDAPRHNVHVTCHIIQVSVHQCSVYPLYFVIAPEQWNLSEAEESHETSGTMEMVCIIIYVSHVMQ